jgi:glycosyltransferase involved in cell wall biosynthesis
MMPVTLRALQVGCVWPSEHGGGGDRVFADLARYLPANGIGLEALVTGPVNVHEPLETKLTTFGATTDGTRSRWMGARRVIGERLDAGGVDLVASHFALYASAAVGRLRRLPHVVHFHGPWARESREEGAGRLSVLAKWSIERTVYRSAVRFIVLSEAFARLAASEYSVPASLIRVIPGAADLKRFSVAESRTEARQALGWPTDRRILVSVRRLVRRTGVDRLIEAMPRVVAAVPDVQLYVGGTGPLRGALERRIRALGLDDCVTLLGYVPDEQLPLMYRAADFNVIPTISLEGFGLTAVEALAAGTPSVVTPIGGLPEILTPLAPDLVLKTTEIEDIAQGLIDALSGRVSVPSDVECRAFATERFSADLMARRVAAVYAEVCA